MARLWGSRDPGPRSRLAGCLIWLLALLAILLLLSLWFGGFQKGTKVGLGLAQPAATAGSGVGTTAMSTPEASYERFAH